MTPSSGSKSPTGTSLSVGNAANAAAGASIGSQGSSSTGTAVVAPVIYPALTYQASGTVFAGQGNKLQATSAMATNLNDQVLALNTQSMNVQCGNTSGCDQDQVDQSTQSSVGPTNYSRMSGDALSALAGPNFRNEPFALYANGIQTAQGLSFTFDHPLPAYPWPAAMSRYDDLSAGPISWTANATASQPIPGMNVTNFPVTVTVTKMGTSGTQVTVNFSVSLPTDQNWMLYRAFPMPFQATYTIDTVGLNILSIAIQGRSYDDNSQGETHSNLTYQLCTKTTPGQATQQYPCS